MMVDSLASIGDLVSSQEHIDVIVEGLPQEFGPVISVIESKFEPSPVDEVEVLLLAHELRQNKFRQKENGASSSINLTQTLAPSSSQSNESNQGQVHLTTQGQDSSRFSGFRSYSRGHGGRSGRGRLNILLYHCSLGHPSFMVVKVLFRSFFTKLDVKSLCCKYVISNY